MITAETLRPNPLKRPLRRPRRLLLVKKRNSSRIVYLYQGVTRMMNLYLLRDQPCLLQKLKSSYLLHQIGAR